MKICENLNKSHKSASFQGVTKARGKYEHNLSLFAFCKQGKYSGAQKTLQFVG